MRTFVSGATPKICRARASDSKRSPRLIAMGFPSAGLEALYRNPRGEVAAFFGARHGAGRVRVYNLCAERSRPAA